MRTVTHTDSRRVEIEDQTFDLYLTMTSVGAVMAVQLGLSDRKPSELDKTLLSAAASALLKRLLWGAAQEMTARDLVAITPVEERSLMRAVADMQDAVMAKKLSRYGRSVH